MSQHLHQIGAAVRQLEAALRMAGFAPGDVGLAIIKPDADSRFRSIALREVDLVNTDGPAPRSIHGVPVVHVYQERHDRRALIDALERFRDRAGSDALQIGKLLEGIAR